jgi:hypothetical protein
MKDDIRYHHQRLNEIAAGKKSSVQADKDSRDTQYSYLEQTKIAGTLSTHIWSS